MREALFYSRLEKNRVKCRLCGHGCVIAPGKRGLCCVRENREGTLYSLNSGLLAACNNDPIEKKPLYHFYPGSKAFSIAAAGCNFKCPFCQNCSISQVSCTDSLEGDPVTAEDIVQGAVRAQALSIAYTYSEPTVFYEMVREVSLKAQERGLKNVLVSNGYMSDEAAKEMSSFIHAANIDLKFFSEDGYRKYTGGHLEKVKSSIEIFVKSGKTWVEITTLVIPGINDSDDELRELAGWIASLDRGIPWHVSRFFPQYRMMDREPTSSAVLEKAYRIGKDQGLEYIYLGNLHGSEHEHTCCPGCGSQVIVRDGYRIEKFLLEKGSCVSCGTRISGRWN
jgi:pyruvate formate lyase activating enzyme